MTKPQIIPAHPGYELMELLYGEADVSVRVRWPVIAWSIYEVEDEIKVDPIISAPLEVLSVEYFYIKCPNNMIYEWTWLRGMHLEPFQYYHNEEEMLDCQSKKWIADKAAEDEQRAALAMEIFGEGQVAMDNAKGTIRSAALDKIIQGKIIRGH